MRVNTTSRSELASGHRPVLALVGAPNSGKTTLYNWLTASQFKVVNYPGSTVEYAIGHAAPRLESDFHVIDTPGTYSLFPKSADEEVTLKALTHDHSVGKVTHVGVVVDGTQLERHLLLARQVFETGMPMILIITMADLLKKSNLHLKKEILQKEFNCQVVLFDGVMGQGLKEIGQAVQHSRIGSGQDQMASLVHWSESVLVEKQNAVKDLATRSFTEDPKAGLRALYERSLRWDKVLLHPLGGIVLFFVIMSTLFTSIYSLAAPLMDLIDGGFAALAEKIAAMGDGMVYQFFGEGLVAAFGAVLVFVPQIFILFIGIGILESTGYLARAATLIDRPFAKLGLSGRSFVPILSGFACAVPAMMATRNLSSRRDRWITNFVIPLMTCSARLPVYALLLGFLFLDAPPWKAGMALAALYMGALLVGAIAAAILNRILAQEKHSFFMMELPLYRKPRYRLIVRQSLNRTWQYVKRAGPMIFIFAVLIWFGMHFPQVQAPDSVIEAAKAAAIQAPAATGETVDPAAAAAGEAPADPAEEAAKAAAASYQLEQSYLGKVGQVLEPIMKPMGVDWRVGIGLLSAFAAREVFVSTMALIFNITGDEAAQADGVLKSMSEAKFADGTAIFTVASVIGLLIFFMIALQCMTTFAIAIRESGSWKFALLQLVAFNLAAYVLAVAVVQGLRVVGVA